MINQSERNLRVKLALAVAFRHHSDEGHHALWLVDQMVRALCGAKLENIEYLIVGENNEYKEFISNYENNGEYEWDTGICP